MINLKPNVDYIPVIISARWKSGQVTVMSITSQSSDSACDHQLTGGKSGGGNPWSYFGGTPGTDFFDAGGELATSQSVTLQRLVDQSTYCDLAAPITLR